MQLFFAEDIESGYCTLNEEESHHCVKVLRKGVGDEISVTDGRGTLCRCRIVEPNAKSCGIEVVERMEEYGRRPFRLHIAVAPTKNTARMEWFIEKAVEMGIDEITPIVCDHSERCVLKHERMEKIVVSAMKQSLKAYKPIIHAPTPFRNFIDNITQQPSSNLTNSQFSIFNSQLFIAYCDGDHRQPLHDAYRAGSDALMLIGPEGDFSAVEVEAALAAGFVPVTLGPSRLRTETAALAATAFFNLASDISGNRTIKD